MVGTILPIVYGERQKVRKIERVSLVAYIIGSLLGGAVLGGVVALVGAVLGLYRLRPSSAPVALLVLMVLAALTLREVGIVRLPLPQFRWQVKRSWADELHPNMAALLYGLVLGFGIFTRIPTGVFYALLIWGASFADVRFGAFTFLLVGLGRALPLIVLSRMTENGEQMFRWSTVLQRWFPVVRLINALVLSAAAGWILAAALRA